MKQKRNKGFSLIELIVVIAILAIIAAGSATLFLSTSTYRAKQAVEEIRATMSETRMQALSKTNAWMELKQRADGTYVITTSYSGDAVLGSSYTITYTKDGDATAVPISTTNSLILTYDRSSGGFSDIKTRNADDSLSGTGAYCDSITVSKGPKNFVIRLYKDTGKHKCEG